MQTHICNHVVDEKIFKRLISILEDVEDTEKFISFLYYSFDSLHTFQQVPKVFFDSQE